MRDTRARDNIDHVGESVSAAVAALVSLDGRLLNSGGWLWDGWLPKGGQHLDLDYYTHMIFIIME